MEVMPPALLFSDIVPIAQAIYFGNCTDWWSKESKQQIPPSWHGPYLMADIEAGMYAGNDTFNPASSPVNVEFASLFLRGHKCEMSLKAGDAQKGSLAVKYDGGRPTHADYNPMRKQVCDKLLHMGALVDLGFV